MRDEFRYARSQFVRTKVKWEPLFEADANTMTMIGDGVVKLNQALESQNIYLTNEELNTFLEAAVKKANEEWKK